MVQQHDCTVHMRGPNECGSGGLKVRTGEVKNTDRSNRRGEALRRAWLDGYNFN